MKAPEHFEVMAGYCCCRLLGDGPLEEMESRVIEAIRFSRKQETDKLLVDLTNWTGSESPPSITDVFYVGSDFAKAAGPILKVSLVARPEMIRPEKFGVTVATNRWMHVNIFDSEEEALDWLLCEDQ